MNIIMSLRDRIYGETPLRYLEMLWKEKYILQTMPNEQTISIIKSISTAKKFQATRVFSAKRVSRATQHLHQKNFISHRTGDPVDNFLG